MLPLIYNPICAAAGADPVRSGLDQMGAGAGLVPTVPSFLRLSPGPVPDGVIVPPDPESIVPVILQRVQSRSSYALLTGLSLGAFETDSEEIQIVHWSSAPGHLINTNPETTEDGSLDFPGVDSWNHVLAQMVYILPGGSTVPHWRKAWWTFWGRFGYFTNNNAVPPSGSFYGDFQTAEDVQSGSVRDPDGGYHPLYGGRFWFYENPFPYQGTNANMPRYVDVSPWTP